jgi:hypothetical protein
MDNSGISPEPIFQMVMGFWVSKALMAAIDKNKPRYTGDIVTLFDKRLYEG